MSGVPGRDGVHDQLPSRIGPARAGGDSAACSGLCRRRCATTSGSRTERAGNPKQIGRKPWAESRRQTSSWDEMAVASIASSSARGRAIHFRHQRLRPLTHPLPQGFSDAVTCDCAFGSLATKTDQHADRLHRAASPVQLGGGGGLFSDDRQDPSAAAPQFLNAYPPPELCRKNQ
jgi:hypothetical protein